MLRKKKIEKILNQHLSNYNVKVVDNSADHIGHNNFNGTQESHFCIMIKKINNLNESTLSIHRKINELLKDDFLDGLHALEIKIIK